MMMAAKKLSRKIQSPIEMLYWHQQTMSHSVIRIDKLFSPRQTLPWRNIATINFYREDVLKRLNTLMFICRKQNPHLQFRLQMAKSDDQNGYCLINHANTLKPKDYAFENMASSHVTILVIAATSHRNDCLVTYEASKASCAAAADKSMVGCEVNHHWLKAGQTFLIESSTWWQFRVQGPQVEVLPFQLIVN